MEPINNVPTIIIATVFVVVKNVFEMLVDTDAFRIGSVEKLKLLIFCGSGVEASNLVNSLLGRSHAVLLSVDRLVDIRRPNLFMIYFFYFRFSL